MSLAVNFFTKSIFIKLASFGFWNLSEIWSLTYAFKNFNTQFIRMSHYCFSKVSFCLWPSESKISLATVGVVRNKFISWISDEHKKDLIKYLKTEIENLVKEVEKSWKICYFPCFSCLKCTKKKKFKNSLNEIWLCWVSLFSFCIKLYST